MRRALTPVAGFSGLLIAAGVALGGCGSGATNSNPPAVSQVTRAAYVTSQGSGFKMLMRLSGDVAGESFSLNMNAAVADHDQRGSLSETVDGKTVESIFDLPYVYVRVPGKPIKGKPWGRFNVVAYMQSLGLSGSAATSGDPSQWIDFLKATGQATTLGKQTVRGVPTTHYHALVDFGRYATVVPAPLRAAAQDEASLLKRISGQQSLPMDVWIDGHNLVRKYQVQVPLCYQGERASESLSAELYGYGTQTVPVPPPASEASELTSELDANSAKALQQLHC